MSSRSVASDENRSRGVEGSDSSGKEGASCGVCRQADNSRMVQCDVCDMWYHYDCVNVDDSIRDKDWSCNKCVRISLEKQKSLLNEQLRRLEQQQKQWQQEQRKCLEQCKERQRPLSNAKVESSSISCRWQSCSCSSEAC